MRRWWAGVALLAAVIGGALVWAFHTTTEVQVSTATVTVGPSTKRTWAASRRATSAVLRRRPGM